MPTWLEQFSRDVQFGLRGLIRTPAFTALAVMSLALGIMAMTAIYSVLHAVVLDPFPYRDVDRLMSVRVSSPATRGGRISYSIDQFLDIAERNSIFEGAIASTISDVLWTGEGDPQRLRGNHGTFNTFDVMGVAPLIGRTPTADDSKPGAEPVVVLGYRFWQRQFGGDPGIIGRQLRLNDTVRIVIGVMPKRVMWRGADVYLPTTFQRGRSVEGVRTVHLLGRLKPGVSSLNAESDLGPIIADLKQREPAQFPEQWRVGLLSFRETFPSAITRDIWVLLGAVALLLLIACANVSNLLLSRATARQRELTVRMALGAGRGRIVRQLLTESLLLAVVAGVAGATFAYAGLPAILAIVPPGTIPDESDIRLNTSVLAFTLIVSALTSIICGLLPALHTARRDFASAMRETSLTLSGSSRHAVMRKALVVAEVALALMLLVGSSLLLRVFVTMQRVELGVDPAQILTMRVPLPSQRYPDAARRAAFFKELLSRIAAMPGVAAAALNSGLHPMGNMAMPVDLIGARPTTDPVQIHNVSAAYTHAMGISLSTGRLFTDSDVDRAQPVALVNERFVRTRAGDRAPLGLVVHVPRLKEPPFLLKDDAFQIVGVVRDTPNAGLADPVMPELYLPFTATGVSNLLVVRTLDNPANITRAVIGQVYAIDRGQPVAGMMTLDRMLRENEYATPRFNLVLLTVFSAMGLALAVIGVYSVMSAAVAQERQEIGVRLALGADGAAIARMVLGRGTRLLLTGTAIGLVGSIAVGRWLSGQVWHVPAFDRVAFGAVSLLLIVVGLAACYWPARRAARIDPLTVIRGVL
jgi:putative ABC transport system permease protein